MGTNRKAGRDRAGIGPEPTESRRRLLSIDDVDGFKVADGEPDVRGWEVRTLSDRELGTVDDLLIDPERGQVVMLEVGLRGRDVRAEVPIRSAQIDRDRKVVIVDSGDIAAPDDARYGDRVEHAATGEPSVRTAEVEPSTRTAADVDGPHRSVDDSGAVVRRTDDGVEERVVESRPMVEEVVVRRRTVDE